MIDIFISFAIGFAIGTVFGVFLFAWVIAGKDD